MAAIGFKYTLEELIYHTPSRAVGIPYEKEKRFRKDTCLFISAMGKTCDIGQLPIATASVYFHVFYAKMDFKQFDRYVIGATALFLAGKVEERGKRCSDICHAFFRVLLVNGNKPTREDFEKLRDKIYIYEQLMMDVIDYNFNVTHPYKFLMHNLSKLYGPNYANREADWEVELKTKHGLAQTAWFFVNDSLRSTLCLQYLPQDIAVAVMYLTLKHKKISIKMDPAVRKTQREAARIKAEETYAKAEAKAKAENKPPPPKPPSPVLTERPWFEELFDKKQVLLEEMSAMILQVIKSTTQENQARLNRQQRSNPNQRDPARQQQDRKSVV